MVADLPVLRMAYLIERDFSEFYAQAASQAEGEAKKTLDMLARWEAGHERLFKSMHDKAFQEYSGMPWGGRQFFSLSFRVGAGLRPALFFPLAPARNLPVPV